MFNHKQSTMRKLSLIFALVAAGFLAHDTIASNSINNPEADAIAVAQDDFSAIDNSELPEAVTEAFTRDFPNAEIAKAYVNQEGQYKLDVTQEDGSSVSLYADSEGKWLDM
jgi:hypothetical protein